MRIGFDAKRAFFNTRGLGNYSRNLIDGLLCYYPEEDYFLFGQKPEEGECLGWFNRTEKNVNIVAPDAALPIKKALWRSYYMENDIRLANLDIYHGLSHEIPFKKRNNRTKYIVTVHDLLFLRFKENFKWFDVQVYLSKIKHSCRHADLIIAVSVQTKQDLVDILQVPAEKIVVNYQSCSKRYYSRPDKTLLNKVKEEYKLPEHFYLFVGAMVKHKNIARIIESIALLPKEIQYPLLIVGKSSAYKKQLADIARKHKLEGKVRFPGYVPLDYLPAFYSLATLFVWPSLFEGFGIPVIESLFCKLPVITSNTGCLPETGGGGAYYVDPESPQDMASGIETVMSNPEMYADMQRKGYAHVQKFHIKNTTASLFDLYSSLACQF